ncbi:MAG: amidase [Candidatus Heimdallarchaeota archaeon]
MNTEKKTEIENVTVEKIESAIALTGLEFSLQQKELMMKRVSENYSKYKDIRKVTISNKIVPALYFSPQLPQMTFNLQKKPIETSKSTGVDLPEEIESLAFSTVTILASLLSTRKISSLDLTKMYLKRIKAYNPILKCVITVTEDLALKQAERADKEIQSGYYRGPLHGIPYGVKDLFAYPGYPTTWGAAPYKDQMLNEKATVIKKLEGAGAVMIGKLSMGALAWGDVWFKDQTKTPWDGHEGSSGSSAGPASATAAGLVAFSIGTETWGSIVSPSNKCGTTGLRPTFGRVSRYGAMNLSWSMDKIGPICRATEDCAVVFDAIYGPDGQDSSIVEFPFNWDGNLPIDGFRIGFDQKAFDNTEYYLENPDAQMNDAAVLYEMQKLGIKLKPIDLPELPIEALSIILSAEAAAAFDSLTRTKRDSLLVRQEEDAWPNVFRVARLIPAVEYIQANRIRTLLIQEMHNLFKEIDVYIAPSFSRSLLLTNLTGHPAVVVPNGFTRKGMPTSITFIGNLYDEAGVLSVAKAFQDATTHNARIPPDFL